MPTSVQLAVEIIVPILTVYLLYRQNQIMQEQNEIMRKDLETRSPDKDEIVSDKTITVQKSLLRTYWPMFTMAVLTVATWTALLVFYFIRKPIEITKFEDRPCPTSQIQSPVQQTVPPADPNTPRDPYHSKEYSNKTPAQLLALFKGRTPLQADALIRPYKRTWMHVQGKVTTILPSMNDVTTVVFMDGESMINCIAMEKWHTAMQRYDVGELIKMEGYVADVQNGQQLYLMECAPE